MLFLKRNVMSFDFQADTIEARVHRDVQDLAFRTDAETAIAGQTLGPLGIGLRGAGGNVRQLLAFGIENPNARTLQTAYCQVDVAFRIDRHAIATVLRTEIDQHLGRSFNESIVIERE